MFGIVLAGIGNFFAEIAESIGKKEGVEKAASIYTLSFVSLFFGAIFIFILGIARDNLVFSLASLPTFIPRAIFEILQAYATTRALIEADRGDFGFVKSLTIPLLLIVDLSLGYPLSSLQMAGMALILVAVSTLLIYERHTVRGLFWLLISAANASITISLYKYNISNFNSVEAEQSLIMGILLAYFFFAALYFAGENPIRFLLRRVFFAQSFSAGFAHVANSFAYLFASPSVIAAAIRSFAVLFALLSGRLYFHEKYLLLRSSVFMLVVLGLVLLIPGIMLP
ncbi:hypothetical protein HY417_01090 [Candidatus Kaiserbacteria bacterium]|nr:hypothetical protein [Candidatus Kaiserbacteria bacterium]